MLCRSWSNNVNFDCLPSTSNIAESQNAILGAIAHDHIAIYFRSILKMNELLFGNIFAHELGVRLRYYSIDDKARQKRKQRRSAQYMSLHGRAPDTINAGITSTIRDSPILTDSLLALLNDSVDYSTAMNSYVRVPVIDSDNNTEVVELLEVETQDEEHVEPDPDPVTPVVSRRYRKRTKRSLSRQLRDIADGELLPKRKRTSLILNDEYD